MPASEAGSRDAVVPAGLLVAGVAAYELGFPVPDADDLIEGKRRTRYVRDWLESHGHALTLNDIFDSVEAECVARGKRPTHPNASILTAATGFH